MTARQEKALAALLNSSTQDEAAKAAGIATRTIKTYLQDEAFRQEYRSRLTELCENAARKAQRELSRSVDTLTAMEQIQAEAQKANRRLAELLGTTDTKTGVYLVSAASISGLRAEIDKDFRMENRIPADSGIIPRLMMWAK